MLHTLKKSESERSAFQREALEEIKESEIEESEESKKKKTRSLTLSAPALAHSLRSCSRSLPPTLFYHDEQRRTFHLLFFSPAGLCRAHGSVQARRSLLRLRERGVHRLQEEGQGPRGVPGGGRRRDLLRCRTVSFARVFLLAFAFSLVVFFFVSTGERFG